MKINIPNFKDVITKATLNFSIETLQLRFSDRIQSDMINGTGTSISILDVPNNVLDTNEELSFNFGDPANNLIPFIALFDNDEVDLSLSEPLFMKFKDGSQRTKVAFCSDKAVKRLGTDDVKDVEWFFEMKIDEDVIKKFDKIKKIGSRFGKIYFVVSNNKLFIETADKANQYSNGVKFKLADIEQNDLSLAYVYNDVCNFFHCIEMNIDKEFTLKVSFDDEQGLGCVYAFSTEGNEKYALISREKL
jgi:hypothetical protein